MTNAIVMSSSADNIDFMIHGLFSYNLFGHEVWITTSHVCILIVMLFLIGFALIANIKMRHATEIPDTFQNILELIVSSLDGVVEGTMGKYDLYIHSYKQYIRSVRLKAADSGLWYNTCTGSDHIHTDTFLSV